MKNKELKTPNKYFLGNGITGYTFLTEGTLREVNCVKPFNIKSAVEKRDQLNARKTSVPKVKIFKLVEVTKTELKELTAKKKAPIHRKSKTKESK